MGAIFNNKSNHRRPGSILKNQTQTYQGEMSNYELANKISGLKSYGDSRRNVLELLDATLEFSSNKTPIDTDSQIKAFKSMKKIIRRSIEDDNSLEQLASLVKDGAFPDVGAGSGYIKSIFVSVLMTNLESKSVNTQKAQPDTNHNAMRKKKTVAFSETNQTNYIEGSNAVSEKINAKNNIIIHDKRIDLIDKGLSLADPQSDIFRTYQYARLELNYFYEKINDIDELSSMIDFHVITHEFNDVYHEFMERETPKDREMDDHDCQLITKALEIVDKAQKALNAANTKIKTVETASDASNQINKTKMRIIKGVANISNTIKSFDTNNASQVNKFRERLYFLRTSVMSLNRINKDMKISQPIEIRALDQVVYYVDKIATQQYEIAQLNKVIITRSPNIPIIGIIMNYFSGYYTSSNKKKRAEKTNKMKLIDECKTGLSKQVSKLDELSKGITYEGVNESSVNKKNESTDMSEMEVHKQKLEAVKDSFSGAQKEINLQKNI